MRRIATAIFFLFALAIPAFAHPHVWVTIRSEIVYAPDGSIAAVRHAWTFDDMFSAFATQGFPQQTKGTFTREELAPLAEVNVTSLKEYSYFTFGKIDGGKIEFADPKDYWLEYKDAALTLHFTLPLKTPVKTKAASFEIYDESFFVAFDLMPKDPVSLTGAPAGCRVATRGPQEMTAAQSKRLSELDVTQKNTDDKLDASFANRITVSCP
jgi:ABC-type uncharacterized transport system substrate-binding protein